MSETSVAADPSQQLLDAIKLNDFAWFERLLEEGLNNESTHLKPCLSTLLQKTCAAPDKPKFVVKLLSVGAVVNCVDNDKSRAPIHLAAMNGCEDVLRVLMGHDRIEINKPDDDGNSALHLATMGGHAECTRLLLQSKHIEPNTMNNEGMTPAYIAATSNVKNENSMRPYLKCPKVNLDAIVCSGESLTEVIAKNHPKLIPFRYLYANDEEGFVSCIEATGQLDGDDGEYTFLQYACDYGLPEAVKTLLALGADPNGTSKTNPKYPVLIASYRGFASVISAFLESPAAVRYHQSKTGSVLHEVIKGSSGWKHRDGPNSNDALRDHDRSLKILLRAAVKRGLFDVNSVDGAGNTCLHYAVKTDRTDHVHRLLDGGSYVCAKNNSGKTPLADIGRDALESYLNKYVTTNGLSRNDEEYGIVCSYRFLRSPRKTFDRDRGNVAAARSKHPQDTEVAENCGGSVIPETEPLLYMADSPELRPLLTHPVLVGFLHLKWMKIQMFYLANLSFYLGFLLFLTAYVVSWTFDDGKAQSDGNRFLRIATCGFLAALVARELFQFVSSPIGYATNAENWFELSLIALTSCLLCERFSSEIRIPLSAVTIQISWAEFIRTSGRHPWYAVQWEMFRVVTKNFVDFLLWYSLFIIAFVFCFYVLFKNTEDFKSVFLTGFKIVVMLTGELNAGGLDFAENAVVKRAVLVLFIFFILLVLVNLLTGVAVSDTQAIKNDAEIIAHVSRVNFIYSIEAMVVTDRSCTGASDQPSKFSCWVQGFGSRLMLFSDDTKNAEITILPNKNNAIESESSSSSSRPQERWYSKWQICNLDDDTVNKAKSIIKSNSEEHENNYSETVEIFDKKCTQVEDTIKEIRELLNKINYSYV